MGSLLSLPAPTPPSSLLLLQSLRQEMNNVKRGAFRLFPRAPRNALEVRCRASWGAGGGAGVQQGFSTGHSFRKDGRPEPWARPRSLQGGRRDTARPDRGLGTR